MFISTIYMRVYHACTPKLLGLANYPTTYQPKQQIETTSYFLP